MPTLAPLRYVFGRQGEDEPLFEKILDESHVQIRSYHPYCVAKVRIESVGDDRGRETAYVKLLGYVLGKNSRQQKLDAVLPVVQEELSVHPSALLQLEVGDGKIRPNKISVSMVLPSGLTAETAPAPLDPDIQIHRVPRHLTAAIKFSGFCGTRKRARLTKYLSIWLAECGYSATSSARIAKYDPPFTLPFLRRNEIHIDVVKR